jgi:hypothetical protein
VSWVEAAPLLIAAGGSLYGHAARRVERTRFRVTMAMHGYTSHAAYVDGPEWGRRRGAYLRTHPGRCWCCYRRRRPGFPIHHLDYSRAGAGHERDRDLRLVCEPCHHRFHRWDRPHGLLRGCGVTLRGTTYLVRLCWWPARLARR